jgi:ribosome-associated translation inhibitor RaiA
MAEEIRLGGNIALIGFDKLEPAELAIIRKIIGVYAKKLQENGGYNELKMSLRQHQHGKTFKHEIEVDGYFDDGIIGSSETDWNIFTALSSTLKKVLAQKIHKNKKEIRKERKPK